jgi:hypothetical protein
MIACCLRMTHRSGELEQEPVYRAASPGHRRCGMSSREFVQDGGLISYGPNLVEMTRRAATFVDKIPEGGQAR